MIRLLDKIFNKKVFLIYSVFYCAYKVFPYMPFTKYTTYALVFLGIATFTYQIIRNPKSLIFVNMYIIYAYLIICVLSLIINGIPSNKSLYRLIVEYFTIFCTLVFFMSRNITETNDDLWNIFYIIMKHVLITTFVLGILNLISIFFSGIEYRDIISGDIIKFGFDGDIFRTRFSGIMGNPNLLSHFAISSIPSSVFFIFANDNKIIKKIAIVNLVLQVLLLILSNSRMMIIALIFEIIYFVYMIYRNYKYFFNNNVKSIIITLLVFIIFAFVYYVVTRGINFYVDDRIALYKLSLHTFLNNNILFGSSYSEIRNHWRSSIDYFATFDDYYKKLYIFDFNPHNTFLRVLCLEGILGFSLIFVLFIRIIYMFFKLMNFDNKELSSKIKIIILVSGLYLINTIANALTEGSILANLWMYMNFLFAFSFGIIAQLYHNVMICRQYE